MSKFSDFICRTKLHDLKTFVYLQDEYDRYISLLLDLQEVQNDGLLGRIDLLSEQATSIAEQVRKEQMEVEALEKQAMELINENER